MAKRQKNHQVSVSFHYLVKGVQRDDGSEHFDEVGFSEEEFGQVVRRLMNTRRLDDTNEDVIRSIKIGRDLPFNHHEEVERGLHFGDFEGAYYGQKYRNNRLGTIEAESLNLRGFHYLVTRTRDGKILLGVTYHGLFGDYEGISKCFSHILRGNHRTISKPLKSISTEIGEGHPVSLKLTYRKAADRPERPSLFATSGVIAIRNTDFGEEFEDRVIEAARRIQGTEVERKRVIADIVNQGELLELSADDIVGCSAIVRQNGRTRTVYFIGDNNFSTKFFVDAAVDEDGITDREQVKREMIRVMRDKIIPMLR